MSSSWLGKNLKISVYGQSHGRAIGILIDGLPAGEEIDTLELGAFLSRRRPGKNKLSTSRSEPDMPIFLSGLLPAASATGETGECKSECDANKLVTCGSPLCAMIENTNVRSADYNNLIDKPRPGHADYTAHVKWHGQADMRGGGHFSGRLTAPLCIAGGIAKQILARKNIFIGAHLAEVAGIPDTKFPLSPDEKTFAAIASKAFPVIDDMAGEKMQSEILRAAESGDSVGGVIECAAINLPAGLGDPMFDGVENKLAAALFGIPAVKGVEFGAGFAAARMRGSENNDPFCVTSNCDCNCENAIRTVTNNCGGILGGITNGMPIVLRVAIKPTPSISREQKTVSLSQNCDTELAIHGRHDPCIAHRAVPVVEAVTAMVLLDMMISDK